MPWPLHQLHRHLWSLLLMVCQPWYANRICDRATLVCAGCWNGAATYAEGTRSSIQSHQEDARYRLVACMHLSTLRCSIDIIVIGLLYMAYPNGYRRNFTFLPRLRPYRMRGSGSCIVLFPERCTHMGNSTAPCSQICCI